MATKEWLQTKVRQYMIRLNREKNADLIDFIEFCTDNGITVNRLFTTAMRDWQRQHAFNTIEEIKYLCSDD